MGGTRQSCCNDHDERTFSSPSPLYLSSALATAPGRTRRSAPRSATLPVFFALPGYASASHWVQRDSGTPPDWEGEKEKRCGVRVVKPAREPHSEGVSRVARGGRRAREGKEERRTLRQRRHLVAPRPRLKLPQRCQPRRPLPLPLTRTRRESKHRIVPPELDHFARVLVASHAHSLLGPVAAARARRPDDAPRPDGRRGRAHGGEEAGARPPGRERRVDDEAAGGGRAARGRAGERGVQGWLEGGGCSVAGEALRGGGGWVRRG